MILPNYKTRFNFNSIATRDICVVVLVLSVPKHIVAVLSSKYGTGSQDKFRSFRNFEIQIFTCHLLKKCDTFILSGNFLVEISYFTLLYFIKPWISNSHQKFWLFDCVWVQHHIPRELHHAVVGQLRNEPNNSALQWFATIRKIGIELHCFTLDWVWFVEICDDLQWFTMIREICIDWTTQQFEHFSSPWVLINQVLSPPTLPTTQLNLNSSKYFLTIIWTLTFNWSLINQLLHPPPTHKTHLTPSFTNN